MIAGEFSKLRMFSFPGGMQGLWPWFSSVQSLSHVQLFVTPWTAACQASLSITNSWSFVKLMSIESVMSSNHLIFHSPLLLLPSIFPRIRAFSKSQFFTSSGQRIGVSASASVLPRSIQGWFPLGLTGWISLQSKPRSIKKYVPWCFPQHCVYGAEVQGEKTEEHEARDTYFRWWRA